MRSGGGYSWVGNHRAGACESDLNCGLSAFGSVRWSLSVNTPWASFPPYCRTFIATLESQDTFLPDPQHVQLIPIFTKGFLVNIQSARFTLRFHKPRHITRLLLHHLNCSIPGSARDFCKRQQGSTRSLPGTSTSLAKWLSSHHHLTQNQALVTPPCSHPAGMFAGFISPAHLQRLPANLKPVVWQSSVGPECHPHYSD